MKELTMFYLKSCPYCKRAFGYMNELKAENPAYADIPLKLIEEREEAELANSYDYYYVPTYYMAGEKVHEGAIDKDGVKAVLDAALA
ncbi:MAG: glutaredoxin [Oscillospiraceae bacterium]